MAHLAVAVEDVDGDEDHAGLHAGEIDVDHLDGVREVDAEAVAGAEALVQKEAGEPVTARVEVAEGVSLAAKLPGGD